MNVSLYNFRHNWPDFWKQILIIAIKYNKNVICKVYTPEGDRCQHCMSEDEPMQREWNAWTPIDRCGDDGRRDYNGQILTSPEGGKKK